LRHAPGGRLQLRLGQGARRPGLQRQPALLFNALPDQGQAVEVGVGRGGVGYRQDDAVARSHGFEEVVEVGVEIVQAGCRRGEQGLDQSAHEGQLAGFAPAFVVGFDGQLGHGRAADRLGHVHAGVGDNVDEALVLTVAVADDELALGGQIRRGFAQPGGQLLLEVGRVGDHVVVVGAPEDDLGR